MTLSPNLSEEGDTRQDVVAAVFVTEPFEAWLPTFASLAADPRLTVVAGAQSPDTCAALESRLPGIDVHAQASASHLVENLRRNGRRHVLLVWAPALFPDDFLSPALQAVREDLRVGSVSFLSNVAGYAGFPLQDVINIHQIGDMDEVSVTRKLRTAPFSFGMAPLAYPVGPAVLFSSQGLSLLAQFPDHGNSVWVSIAEYGTRLRQRGMVDLLDPSTFVSRPLDMPDPYPQHAGLAEPEWLWLNHRSPALMRMPTEVSEQKAPFREALAWARSVVFGIRVIIDGSCLGPKEMGTQVALLAQVEALANRDEVEYLGVAVPGPVPAYATGVLAHPKVDARLAPSGDLSAFSDVDIIHCPFQTPDVDLAMWRTRGRRTVITLHDLIAFQTPAYYNVSEHWFEYRQGIRERASSVDGILASSEEARTQIRLERLAVDEERLFVVPLGTKHLQGHEGTRQPDELLARGFAEKRFILVLGANYAHKNRDIAVRVVEELQSQGQSIHLVLAGALVPYGSSRLAEMEAGLPNEWAFVIPDVSSEERNWLLEHAELVLYPTSAEGFGLVPHEAAAFGTPTVVVPFGPFAERLPELPVSPADWGVETLADACLQLLSDPLVAQAQVEALILDEDKYDWPAAAAATVNAYQSLLARPSRSAE
jgi:glycosyltransferase involved in cell wall biosynthesis